MFYIAFTGICGCTRAPRRCTVSTKFAGKTVVRPVEFEVANLFGALRGMLRPLLVDQSVAFVFEDAGALPPLYTDEAKVSQILRNFISSALKFTERGEVADTGIGIAPEDQESPDSSARATRRPPPSCST